MKRTYKMTHPKIKTARLFEGVKGDINKYVKRERRKELPKGVDYWDFDCRFGPTEEEAKPVHMAELNTFIDAAEAEQLESFYVEVIATEGRRIKKPVSEEAAAEKPESVEPPATSEVD
jgi:hypothetical protein